MLEIGSSLREARSRRGLELVEVEAATMIRTRYLEALEEERFELLPAGPYARSFLREYADFLGLDGEIFVGEYEQRFAPEPEPPSPPPPPGVRLAQLLGSLSLTRGLIILAVALIGVGLWQLGGSGEKTGVKPTPTAPQTPTRTSTKPHAPARHPAAPAAKPSANPSPTLVLTAARGSCWLSVRIGSDAGPTVFERTLQQGQTVRFGLRRALWIRLGAPWNLDATIGGRPVISALPPRTGNVIVTAGGLRLAP
jgi:Helix-turn-helix domain/RodZ C-terminal domain